MKKILCGFLLFSLLFSACNKINQAGVILVDKLNANDKSFLQGATLTNLAEIASAKLADSVALRAEVKSFAKMVIANRTSEQLSLDSIARKWGITLPVIPEADQLAAIAVLRQVGPSLFDAAYLAATQGDQKTAELLYQQEIKLGGSAQVLSYAKRILPVVESDLLTLESLLPH